MALDSRNGSADSLVLENRMKLSILTKSALFRILEAVIVTVLWGCILVIMELVALNWGKPVRDMAALPFTAKVLTDTTNPGARKSAIPGRTYHPAVRHPFYTNQ